MKAALTVLAWLGVAACWLLCALGSAAPWLGGDAPGRPDRIGFAAETLVALWVPLGAAGLSWALLCWACRARRAALCCLPVVLWTLAPEGHRRIRGAPPIPPRTEATLRVAAVNLAAHLREDEAQAEVLRALDADVLVLSELSVRRQADAARWLAGDYPHRVLGAPPAREGYATEGLELGIWSRLPFAGEAEVLLLTSSIAQVRVPVRFAGRTVAVYGVHPRKPFPFQQYRGTYRERVDLLAWLRQETLPCVVAGDFNAPARSALLARLEDRGLRHTAAAALGHVPVTWPYGSMRRRWFGLALDHVLCSEHFAVAGFGLAPPTRADHRAILAALRLAR